jgi:hypothetical protein
MYANQYQLASQAVCRPVADARMILLLVYTHATRTSLQARKQGVHIVAVAVAATHVQVISNNAAPDGLL